MPLHPWLIGLIYVVVAVLVFFLEKSTIRTSRPADRKGYRGSREEHTAHTHTRNAIIRAISSSAVLLAIWWMTSSKETSVLITYLVSLTLHILLLRYTPWGYSQAPSLLLIAIMWLTGIPILGSLAVLLGKWVIQGKGVIQEFILAEGVLWTMAAFGTLEPSLALWGHLIIQAGLIIKGNLSWGKRYADLLILAILADILLAIWVVSGFEWLVFVTGSFALALVAAFHFLRKWLGYRHVTTKLSGLAVVACSLLFSAAPLGTPEAGYLASVGLLLAAPMLDGHRGRDKFTPILALVVLSSLLTGHILSDQSLLPMNLAVGLAMGIWVGHWSTRRKTRQAFETSFIILVGASIGLFGEHISSSLGGQGAMLLFGAGFMLTNLGSLWLAAAIISLGGLMPSAFHPEDIHAGKTDRSGMLLEASGGLVPLEEVIGRWKLNPKSSTLDFTIIETNKEVKGSFEKISGELEIPQDWQQASMEVEVKISSVKTGYELRDQSILQDRDFFHGRKYPKATFTLAGLERGASSYYANGELTLRGETRKVSFPVDFLGKHPEKGFIVFKGSFDIDRTAFGMPHSPAMSDRVKISFSFDFEPLD